MSFTPITELPIGGFTYLVHPSPDSTYVTRNNISWAAEAILHFFAEFPLTQSLQERIKCVRKKDSLVISVKNTTTIKTKNIPVVEYNGIGSGQIADRRCKC